MAAGHSRFFNAEKLHIMPYQIITMPFDGAGKVFVPDELNRFCLNKNILSRRIEFFTHMDVIDYAGIDVTVDKQLRT